MQDSSAKGHIDGRHEPLVAHGHAIPDKVIVAPEMGVNQVVRGAPDLVGLWRSLPAAGIRYRAPGMTTSLMKNLNNDLRARAWRELCTSPPPPCIEKPQNCQYADQRRCLADVMFPLPKHCGGPQNWRMATLFPRWWPSVDYVYLIGVGTTARESVDWAGSRLDGQYGLGTAERLDVSSFGDVELGAATRWRLTIVLPWQIKARGARNSHRMPDEKTVAHELINSMKNRAKKYTSLCIDHPLQQRLGAHLAHYVSEAILYEALMVECVSIKAEPPVTERSGTNRQSYDVIRWTGTAELKIEEGALPWLSLLAIFGGGDNADHGYGSLELFPLGNT